LSNTTSLPDAEATPTARLIVKAALAYQQVDTSTRTKEAEARARQDAYGQVAADVLDIAMTPQAFALVIGEAVRDNPHPYTQAVSRGRAVELRETWQRAIVADVLDRLGNPDLRPTAKAQSPAPRAAAGPLSPPACPYPSRPAKAGALFHDISHVRKTLAERIGARLVTDEAVAAMLAVLAREDITSLGITIYVPPGGLAPLPGLYSPRLPAGSPAWTDPDDYDVHWCRNYATPGDPLGSWSPETQARLDTATTVAELQTAWAQFQDVAAVDDMPGAEYRHALAHLYARHPEAAPAAVRYRLPAAAAIPAVMAPEATGESRAAWPPERGSPDDPGAAGQGPALIVTDAQAGRVELHATQGRAACATHVQAGGDPSQQGLGVTVSRGPLAAQPHVITPVAGEEAVPEAGH
jgi:hypothetical protein